MKLPNWNRAAKVATKISWFLFKKDFLKCLICMNRATRVMATSTAK
jgi:hypothetical protein